MDYIIKPIDAKTERAFLYQWHYSKKAVPNSSIRMGCYDGNKLVGVISFGKIINCVPLFRSISNRFGLEINRLAMVDEAPKNSESWFLMRSVGFLKKQYSWLRFISTWADGLRCQGGIIYKAAGFLYLRKIPVSGLYQLPDGSVIHQIAFDKVYLKKYYNVLQGIKSGVEKVRRVFGEGVKELAGGFQYQYIYLLDKTLLKDLTMQPIPYEKNVAVVV